jgi:hypothetical protein
MTLARYSFLPWLRRGISAQVQTPAAASSRALVPVTVSVANDTREEALPPRQVQLIGPGDVIGFTAQMVIRTEPRNLVTDFEPNYLACVEFYDEDFAWRYTPAPPDTAAHRLKPWITLLVLKKKEFTRERKADRPLSSIKLAGGLDTKKLFAREDQLWAWAHVHLNESLGTGHAPNLEQIDAILRRNPDLGYCRLVCPRRLEADTAYQAFVIPTFEVGRKAGLGEPVADADPGLKLAWASANQFPVYYEWSFATGPDGDFEDLVTAIKPFPMPKEVGIRDLDIHQPGFRMPPIVSAPDDVVGLEGALLSPFSEPKPLDAASNFPAEIEKQVNLAAEAVQTGVGAGDPYVTAPLYGRWHAMVERISTAPENRTWVNELNGDPRFRAVAGMGTLVVQKNQEEYMRLAWQQVGDVLALNRKVHFVQMALQASHTCYLKHLVAMPDAKGLAVMSPVLAKVMGSPVTVRHLVQESRLTSATLSGAMRKQLRPRGRIARAAFPAELRRAAMQETIRQVNDGKISAAPPRRPPPGPTLERAVERQTPPVGALTRWLLRRARLIMLLLLALLLVLALFAPLGLTTVVAVLAGAAVLYAYQRAQELARRVATSEALMPASFTPEAVAAIPPNDAFTMPAGDAAPEPAVPTGGPDSPDARDFRSALIDLYGSLSLRAPPVPPRPALLLESVHQKVLRAVAPTRSFPLRVARTLRAGDQNIIEWAKKYHDTPPPVSTPTPEEDPEDRIVPAMAYPDIKKAMYEPLRDVNPELFVPNLQLIPRNTISLMVQNQPFIESYMMGLNHELARELLWREYPTDQRPSSFRQFWDVSNYVDMEGLDAKVLAEKLRDITRIHEWKKSSLLGDHNNRDPDGRFRRPKDPLDRMVMLVIRGDLLKRYPNTIIYAQHATWGTHEDDKNLLVLWDETGEKLNQPGKVDPNIRYPLYKAVVKPDIHFIGFDLTVREVRGHAELTESADARARFKFEELGWFFVLKEAVGEPRFGLDQHVPASPSNDSVWDNVSWEALGNPAVIDVTATFSPPLPPAPNADGVNWGANSADTAHILFQKPVLVGVHARQMLKDPKL